MCGIVGYIGKERQTKFLVDKLKLLEYRGYDSAGYVGLKNGKFVLKRKVGRIKNLENEIDENEKIVCAIAHTRWATHGKVTEVNCHPHISSGEKWAVVHNGIAENFDTLKMENNLSPKSDTDTAVISDLLEKRNVKDIFGFIDAISLVQGSFAIAALCSQVEDTIFLAKKKSPLFVSKNENGEFLIASDPICFKDFSNKYYTFLDDEFAVIKNDGIEFFSKNHSVITKTETELQNNFENVGKNGYSSYMLKEIFDEKDALKNQVETYRSLNLFSVFDKNFLQKFKKVKFIGCGTAFHAGQIGAKYFQKLLNIDARAEYASEFIYSEPVFADSETLFIFISQSGETADTISALNLAKSKGSTCVVLTNVMYSSLSRMGDITLPVCAGVEIAVASTKAYVCQLTALYMLASHFRNLSRNYKINYFEEILSLSDKLYNFDTSKLEKIAASLSKTNICVFIGKDMDFITANEACLKVKETTYTYSNSYPSGELKHGYLALIEEGTPVIAFACNKSLNVKTFNSVKEAIARGAVSIIFTNSKEKKNEENVIYFSEENELLLPVLEIVPLQYLSCLISNLKNIDPDKPRNLAKSVTVE